MTPVFEWVDNSARLAELVAQWQQQPALALDTEFIRSRTFFPKIGLLQIASSEGIYLIDPLAIEEPQPLRELLTNPGVVKVLHSCTEDLDVFNCYLQVLPQPLFDSQIAAAFAGYGASIGYANLLAAISGHTIPKQETRSDWLQRPLSQAQLNYAALDVADLLAVYQQLASELQAQQRLNWVEAECQKLLDKASHNESHDQYYQRVKSAWKLKRPQLAVLQQLCAWREHRAREQDVPRSRLIKDGSLLTIAQRLPSTIQQLRRVADIHPRFIEKYGEHCLQLIEQALANSAAHPERLAPPLSPDEVTLFKHLKAKVVAMAEAMKIPPEFLARKADLETMVRSVGSSSVPLPASLTGWREDIVGRLLLDEITSLNTEQLIVTTKS